MAVVMTSFEAGGTERQMIELIRRLDPGRWQVHVACFHARGHWLGRVRERAASITEFPLKGFRRADTARFAWAFMRWCRERRLALVHTSELYSNVFALPAAAAARVPVRIGNRREINPDKTLGQIALQRAAYAFAHKVVANSRTAANRLLQERVPSHKVAIVPNGLDMQTFAPHSPRPLPRRVVMVANLRPEKGHDILVDAAVEVLRRVPDARFDLVGAGPQLRPLRARVEARAVSRSFSFLGHQDDVPAHLAAADIFVLPSRSEAFPNAVLEAMAAGLPIVASGIDGILEIVDDDRTGLLVPPRDPMALADRLCRLMADPALGARLGAAARAEVETRYSFDRMVVRFEQVYLTELARRGRSQAADALQPVAS
jgi:glycosyltransferase involved in cell wall biosynthesis